MEEYFTIEDLLNWVEEPNRSACLRLLADNRKLFEKVPGSSGNHQCWLGGYFDHIQEVMNIGLILYFQLDELRPLPFPMSDLLLVLFLHDLEKPWKYDLVGDQLEYREGMRTKEDHHKFRLNKLREYGIVLTQDQENAIKYTEGEIGEHSRKSRIMSPLATVAHMSDVASARLWPEHPLEKDDPWSPGRVRTEDPLAIPELSEFKDD